MTASNKQGFFKSKYLSGRIGPKKSFPSRKRSVPPISEQQIDSKQEGETLLQVLSKINDTSLFHIGFIDRGLFRFMGLPVKELAGKG